MEGSDIQAGLEDETMTGNQGDTGGGHRHRGGYSHLAKAQKVRREVGSTMEP